MITLRLRSTEPTLKIRTSQVIPTPELQAAITGAQSAQAAAEAAQAAAETAETNAETAEAGAASSASSASTSASNASSSASSASSSASSASTSATNASNSASAASTSASNAASSASSASSSASSAAASAADAAMSADSFDDVWLGTKTSDPTLDNDGNPLVKGQLYFNALSDTLKIYNGASWQSYTAASGLAAIVDDTSPSLGGNLSLNGHNITASGSETIDGRDVSADGTKLDTIASNADVTSATNVGSSIHGATGKTTPVDADEFGGIDSAASNVLKKFTWANIKATLKTYFDGIYTTASATINDGYLVVGDGGSRGVKKSTGAPGDAAFKNTGTSAGTLAAGDDSRIITATITFVIDGGGGTISTGMKGYLEIPFNCTINRNTLLADQSGSIVVDIFKCTYSNFDPTTHPASGDKITASAPPTISSAKKSQDSTLTGWTTSISAGDILGFNVNSVTSVQKATLSLKVSKT